ncbi:hypothetical protein AN642_01785 [Epulopiscium sp. SCG-B10WGA-EpuloA2]|nr:hypothetical protein AN642_01785 [Epulopiscium sp. SCG-B10WGA-EpuloA2]
MKLKKTITGIILATLVMGFVGCSSQEDNVLKMGTNAAFPPFEYIEGTEIVGFDVDLANLIADELDMELEIMDMEFNTLTGAVASGMIDMAVAGMTDTPERRESVAFTDGYYKSKQMIIIQKDSEIKNAEDLIGKTIGVQLGTTGDQFATANIEQAKIIRFDKGALAIADLLNKTVDAVIIDEEPAKNFIKDQPTLIILETPFVEEEYAIAIAKENTILKDEINKALIEIKENGKYDEIFDKYFEKVE